MDSTRGVALWKKETVLLIFAKWCNQNSQEFHLAPWQCLTREMTLFDVVYLDILHGFDVPNNVLLEYVDREWSAEVVCKLACCYSMNVKIRPDRNDEVKYSLNLQTLLMIRQAINYKHQTLESIITSVAVLMRCEKYEIAERVLESANPECSSVIMFIRCKELHIVNHKMKNEMQEMSDTQGGRNLIVVQSIEILLIYFLSVCYKCCGDEENREAVLTMMSVPVALFCLTDPGDDSCHWHYEYALLMLEVFENSQKWESLHQQIYKRFISKKIKLIKQESDTKKVSFERLIVHEHWCRFHSSKTVLSCNSNIVDSLIFMADQCDHFKMYESYMVNLREYYERSLTYSMLTTADKTYYSQVLIFNRKLERAISILKDVVEQEGAYSISMVIWPRELYGACFIDDNLRNELIKSSKDYVVFPTNLYARYLLSMAYSSLGQEENRSNNLAELIVLRERYSQIPEFAPMLDIMSVVVVG